MPASPGIRSNKILNQQTHLSEGGKNSTERTEDPSSRSEIQDSKSDIFEPITGGNRENYFTQ